MFFWDTVYMLSLLSENIAKSFRGYCFDSQSSRCMLRYDEILSMAIIPAFILTEQKRLQRNRTTLLYCLETCFLNVYTRKLPVKLSPFRFYFKWLWVDIAMLYMNMLHLFTMNNTYKYWTQNVGMALKDTQGRQKLSQRDSHFLHRACNA